MARIKKEEIKVVIVNPEAIPKAEKRLTKVAYELYIKALAEGRIKQEYITNEN